MRNTIESELGLSFNEKTQILPLRNGIDFLGFHFYLSNTGKVIRKVRTRTKRKYKSRLREMKYLYERGEMSPDEIHQVLCSYHAHLDHGHAYKLQQHAMNNFVLGGPANQKGNP